MRRT
jgi:hypothetical protein